MMWSMGFGGWSPLGAWRDAGPTDSGGRKLVVTPPRSMTRRSHVVHRVPATTAVVQPDEHDANSGIQEPGDFASEER